MKPVKRFGLIGKNIGYSLSPEIFRHIFRREAVPYSYEIIDTESSLLDEILSEDWAGLNVTVPYKKTIIPLLDFLDESAQNTGAVNTVVFRDGKRIGYNTDIDGFEFLFSQTSKPVRRRALILGSGASSNTVAFVLEKHGIPFTKVSRKPGPGMLTYTSLDRNIIGRHGFIINTTPLGGPNHKGQAPPIPYHWIGKRHTLIDLNYLPRPTGFLEMGLRFSPHAYDGFPMLVTQARMAWELWKASF